MYNIVYNIINHVWVSTGATGDQQYIYYACSVIIPVLVAVFVDLIYRVFRHFWR